MSQTVRYPGRVCLLGEHCDWWGGASLTVPLEQGIQVCAEPAERGLSLRTTLEGQALQAEWDIHGGVDPAGGALRFVPAAAAALRARQVAIPAVLLTVEADLPAGRGLSSSAAFCVAVLDALARHAGCRLEGRELAALATHVERDLLGVACGPLDPLACVSREPILLRWGSNGAVSITAIHPRQTLHLVVASFAAPRNTPAILRALQQHAHSPAESGLDPQAVAAVRAALATFAAAAEQGAVALEGGEAAALGLSMDRCQQAYARMAPLIPALQAPALARAVKGLKAGGALGAKFSGAGGDGSVIALYPDPQGAIQGMAWLRELEGVQAWTCTIRNSPTDPPAAIA
jgi:mevalonate kinase